MNTNWSKPTKYLIGIGLVILGIFLLVMSHAVIRSLIMAALIAMIVRPAISWLNQRAHFSRGLAVGMVYVVMLVLAPLIVMLILPTIINALAYVGNLDYQSILQSAVGWLRSTLITIKATPLPVASLNAYVDGVVDTLLGVLQPASSTTTVGPSLAAILQPLSSAFKAVIVTGANVISKVAMLAFLFLASIYISMDAHTFRKAFLRALPDAYQPEISSLLARIERVWLAFFQGELKLMLFIGVITTIGLLALGMPGALYLGVIAGLLEIIPSLGPFIATIPAVIVALIYGSAYLPISNLAFAGLIIIFYILVQQVENHFIVPRVLGTALELPPLIVMTGIVIGASVAGLLGALLATPIIGSGREVLHYIYRKIQDQEPFPVNDAASEKGTPPSGNWLRALFAELQKRIRSRSPKSREGNDEE